MNNKLLIIGLLAFSLLLFGCAKGGSAAAPPSGASVGSGAPSGAPSGATMGGEETGTPGPEAPQAGGETAGEPEGQPPAQEAAGNTSEQDIGELFNIDTVQPESGSGYDVPAAGEE